MAGAVTPFASIKTPDTPDLNVRAIVSKAKDAKWIRHERLRERDIIRYGKQEGYLKILSVDDILARSSKLQGEKVDGIEHVAIINLAYSKVPSLGPLAMCSSLRICNLSNNYISKINALGSCRQLRKLDLHSNQVTELPDASFWACLEDLTVLYLHDNGISGYGTLKNMSSSPNLSILTMYDTPLSLRQHYRHFVVNAIWTLKALDNIVVSDEEIIEDAKFPKKFASLHTEFHFSPRSLHNEEERSLQDELTSIAFDLAQVNQIQAIHCPVLILQKCIRGYLARSQYRFIQDQRTWAAVSIQRFYRHYKGFPNPPPSPALTLSNKETNERSMSSLKLDYETYIRMRRSKEKSLLSFNTANTIRSDSTLSFLKNHVSRQLSQFKPSSRDHLQSITIDLHQLEAVTSNLASTEKKIEKRKAFLFDNLKQHSSQFKSSSRSRPVEADLKKHEIEAMRKLSLADRSPSERTRNRVGKYYTQHRFLGAVVDTAKDTKQPSREYCERVESLENIEESGKIRFRLSSTKPPCMTHDKVEEIILRTAQGAEDIRHSIRVIENYLASVPPRVAQKTPVVTVDQRMFMRTHGTMNLSCFWAVERAYRERDQATKWRAKSKQVRDMRIRDHKLKEHIRRHKERTNQAAIEEDRKQRALNEAAILMKKQRTLKDLQRKVAIVKNKSDQWRTNRGDNRFVSDFGGQMNSIRSAVVTHERALKQNQTLNSKKELVQDAKESNEIQRENLKQYINQSQEVKRAEVAVEKANIDALLSNQRDKRVVEARDRVRRLKEQDSESIITEFWLHQTLAPPKSPLLAVISDTQMNTFQRQAPTDINVREHDRPVSS